MEQLEGLVAVGKIIGTFGIKGFVKVMPLTDSLERFNELKVVIVATDQSQQKMAIELVKINFHKNLVYLLLKGINDPNEASLLKNSYVMITKAELRPLPTNSYYHFQIIGLKAYDAHGCYLGTIKQILETGANDVYVLEDTLSNKPILIPALKAIIKKIDLDQGKMIVEPPPGLLEI